MILIFHLEYLLEMNQPMFPALHYHLLLFTPNDTINNKILLLVCFSCVIFSGDTHIYCPYIDTITSVADIYSFQIKILLVDRETSGMRWKKTWY